MTVHSVPQRRHAQVSAEMLITQYTRSDWSQPGHGSAWVVLNGNGHRGDPGEGCGLSAPVGGAWTGPSPLTSAVHRRRGSAIKGAEQRIRGERSGPQGAMMLCVP